MNQQNQTMSAVKTGDVAIDGLLAGVGAGVVMAAVLELIGVVSGASLGATIALFDPSGGLAPINGLFAHIAVSGIYGLVFGLLFKLSRITDRFQVIPPWLLGAVYGLLLLAASRLMLTLNQSALLEIPLLYLLIGHIAYGLVLGWLVGGASGNWRNRKHGSGVRGTKSEVSRCSLGKRNLPDTDIEH